MAVEQKDELLLLYDKISKGDKGRFYRFQLAGLRSNTVIRAVMLNELALAGANDFASKVELQKDVPVFGTVVEVKDKLRPIAKLSGGAAYSSSETAETWEKSTKPTFKVDFLLLAHDAKKAEVHIDWIKAIQATVLPVSSAGGGLKPPMGYTNNGAGTLTLTVGTWFNARGLVMNSVDYTPSKQVMSNGYPLYWNCSISLTPYKMITIGEFEDYFQKVNTMSPDKVAKLKAENPNFFDSFVAKVNTSVKGILG